MKSLSMALLALVLAGCTGGGETVVSGFGNTGNYFGVEGEVDILAEELATFPSTPRVTDEELMQIYGAIRDNAVRGDPKAAIVMYKLAVRQRAPKAED